MYLLLPHCILIIRLALILSPTAASTQLTFKALVAPITKDNPTSLYTITINNNEKYVIDLGSPFPWRHCTKHDPRLSCNAPDCATARRYQSPHCPSTNSSLTHGRCLCSAPLSNPISGACETPSPLATHHVVLPWTNGHFPTVKKNISAVVFGCAPQSLFRSLPAGSSGMASFSRAAFSFPMQFRRAVRLQFAICLPSFSSPGVAFFGSEPFFLLPPPGRNITNLLSFTPLLKNPNPLDRNYFIQVKAIAINGRAVEFLQRVLEFDSEGHGGVKFSTVTPYTKLRSHVYRPFLKLFSWSTRGIPRAPKVKPFDLCLNTTNLGSTRVGLPVPQIDIMLGNGLNWTVFGANSMKQVSSDVSCLAFVDGGERAEQAVEVGSYQMENNFLLFDVARNRVGFSSSLLFFQTTCSNFNFTSER